MKAPGELKSLHNVLCQLVLIKGLFGFYNGTVLFLTFQEQPIFIVGSLRYSKAVKCIFNCFILYHETCLQSKNMQISYKSLSNFNFSAFFNPTIFLVLTLLHFIPTCLMASRDLNPCHSSSSSIQPAGSLFLLVQEATRE